MWQIALPRIWRRREKSQARCDLRRRANGLRSSAVLLYDGEGSMACDFCHCERTDSVQGTLRHQAGSQTMSRNSRNGG